jgi:KDO2-lipid IV(A) lauroyltransferase
MQPQMQPALLKIRMSQPSTTSFLLPKYWLLWLAFALIYPITRLPLSIQFTVGRTFGFLLYHLGPARRHIANVNLTLCFPELDTNERKTLLKKHYALYGVCLVESFSAWWASSSLFTDNVTYEGLEHLTSALEQGKGVLLLNGHFTTLEIGGRLLGQKIPFHMIYRAHKNPLFEKIMTSGRERWIGKTIDRRDIRQTLRSLKSNHAVWYGPDQDYGKKHSVFVPFMGVMAATVTGTSRIAKLSGAPVVPYVVRRTTNYGYHVTVFPQIKDFPSDDLEHDATRINQWFEQQIRQEPEDYLWTHRRFKTPPPGGKRPY